MSTITTNASLTPGTIKEGITISPPMVYSMPTRPWIGRQIFDNIVYSEVKERPDGHLTLVVTNDEFTELCKAMEQYRKRITTGREYRASKTGGRVKYLEPFNFRLIN